MTDELSGDAKFKRWFEEQDPFGNSKEKRQAAQTKTVQARPPAEPEKNATTGEQSGDAAFDRWFAEQDPFGNSKEKRQTDQPKTAQARVPASGLFRFGIALPVVILIVTVLGFAFAAGVALRSMH
jgi:hypothetical protein